VLLYRAQSPVRDDSGVFMDGSDPNVDTSSARYNPTTDPPACSNRGSLWLYQNTLGEPTGLATTAYRAPADVPESDLRAIPLGVSLTVPNPATRLTPLTTFTLTDSNDDGKIDQVKINLALESYDTSSTSNGSGEMPASQKLRMSTTVDLPNVM
jgi:hypothetical protein